MKYIITIAYDGSKYMGLQKLKKDKTIQGELEQVLTKMNEAPVKVTCAGRTDRGVHALNQTCIFELQKETTPYKLKYYINRSTSRYMNVTKCEELQDDSFHPRFSVKTKTYKYIINTGSYNPIKEDYVYNYNKNLDISKMTHCANILTGPHNYRAFVVGKQKTCDSIINEITIESKNDNIIITIKGKAFYTYMVRNIVAVLILIGSNSITEKDVKKMLDTGKKVMEYAPAPPNGLYLEQIEY